MQRPEAWLHTKQSNHVIRRNGKLGRPTTFYKGPQLLLFDSFASRAFEGNNKRYI
jgi:hypothetical protein